MKRKKKSYQRPKKPFEKSRIDEENVYKERYGLKNKREIWKTLAKIDYFRGRAKTLAKSTLEEQEVLINKLKALGLPTNSIVDVLGLKVEDLLKRRLPTIVADKKLATTVKGARQMVTHKRILVDGKVVNAPSYIVPVALEDTISIKVKKLKPKPKVEEKKEEAPAESTGQATETPKEKPTEEATETPEEKSEEKPVEENKNE